MLHTWGRDLNYHPHLHFIVPGGAISADSVSWLSSRVDFLIPVLAASVLFRAKYKAIMERLGLLSEIGKRKKFELRSGKLEKQAVHISPCKLQTSNFKLPLRASERFPESASLWLRTSASQNELGMVVDVGNGNTEHGLRVDSDCQAAIGEANIEMP